jgi:hypothetical protein
MTEEDARFALLQTELNAIQSAIRGIDTIVFQIKGWCVTASLAIGGFAVAYHKPALLLIGAGAVVGFFIVNCQFKGIQRVFIDKNVSIDSTLRAAGIMDFLKDGSSPKIVGTALPTWKGRASSWRERMRHYLAVFTSEGLLPNTYSLYLFILVCLMTEALILS